MEITGGHWGKSACFQTELFLVSSSLHVQPLENISYILIEKSRISLTSTLPNSKTRCKALWSILSSIKIISWAEVPV